jgi:hypothetical protein
MQAALDALIPSFVKRAKSDRGRAYQDYLRGMRERVAAIANHEPRTEGHEPADEAGGRRRAADLASSVTLVEYDPDAEARVAAAILYPHVDAPLAELRTAADAMDAEERRALIRAYVGERSVRFHRPGRAFEEPSYSFDILADIGAYRDLQRHRVLTQERQRFGVLHGYETPAELIEGGLDAPFRAALEAAAETCLAVSAEMPEEAQYLAPLAFRVRWRVRLNLRELYHLAELRSAPQGHPSYRRVAQEMYRQAAAVHPDLAEGMRFVDMGDYELERLDAERRLDAKLERLGRDGQAGPLQP